MQEVTIDPLDPALDLNLYDREDLVSAKVQSFEFVDDHKIRLLPGLKKDVEARILDLLNDDQKARRAVHLEVRKKKNFAAARKLLQEMKDNQAQVKANTEWLAERQSVSLGFEGTEDGASPPAGPPKPEPLTGDEIDHLNRIIDLEDGEVAPALAEHADLVAEIKAVSGSVVQLRLVTERMVTVQKDQLDTQKGTNSELRTQTKNAKNSAKSATIWAVISTVVAGLSLTIAAIALLHPVEIDQPSEQPVPVEIVDDK